MRRRRLLALCTVFVLLAFAGGAGAARSPVKRSPSLLWKSYPLKQRTATSQPRPLRPPALAVGAGSSSGDAISPYLVALALFGGAMLALTGVVAKSHFKDAAAIATARKRRSAEPEPTEDAKPDMLVALAPVSATADEEPAPDLVESQTKPSVSPRPVPIADEGDVEPEQPDQTPSTPRRPLRILLVRLQPAKKNGSESEPPLRALQHPLFRAIEDHLSEVEAPGAEEEPEAERPPLHALPDPLFRPIHDQLPEVEAPAEGKEPEGEPPLEAVSETEPEAESEPELEPERHGRIASREEDTEVVAENCQIRLWRGYFRYQLYVASGSSDVNRAVALSPYFRLKDPAAPGPGATAALRELLDQLEAEGWAITHEGRRWYSFTLERPL